MGRLRRKNKHLPQRMSLDDGTFYWRPYVNGKQQRIPIGKTFSDAILEYGKLEAKKAEPEKTLDALIKKFLADTRQPRAKATQKNYEIWGRQLCAIFVGFKPEQIQGHHAARILDEHPKRVTGQRLVGLLSNVLGYAVRIGWMPGPNPLYGFKKGPKSKRTRYIEDGEWQAILGKSPLWLSLFLRMAYLTALRKSDLLSLKWSSVKDDGLYIPIQKTKAHLIIERSPEIDELLEDVKDLRKRVVGLNIFSTKYGKPINYTVLMRAYKRAQEEAGVPNATLHDIRRKRITDIERTHGLQLAQRLAAHTDPRTTMDYVVNMAVRVSLPSGKKVATG